METHRQGRRALDSRRTDAPPAIRGYRLPWRLALPLGRDVALGRSRPFAADCAALVAAAPQQPVVSGREQIPKDGPFVLIANHLEGSGLWIGWGAAVLTTAVASVRADPAPIHWLVLRDMDRSRVRGLKRLIPATSWAFARVARAWSMVALPRDGGPATRGSAVRTLLRLALKAPLGKGRPIGLFPEGERGDLGRLGEAAPGAGPLLALLARGGVPALPAGLWLEGNRIHARFGSVLRVTGRESATLEAMQAIATLLPQRMRGCYASDKAGAERTAASSREEQH